MRVYPAHSALVPARPERVRFAAALPQPPGQPPEPKPSGPKKRKKRFSPALVLLLATLGGGLNPSSRAHLPIPEAPTAATVPIPMPDAVPSDSSEEAVPVAGKVLPIETQRQVGRSCGTVALSMVFRFLGNPVSREALDRQVRNLDIGVTPSRMAETARQHGFHARIYNNATFEEIRQHIDAGRGVILFTEEDRNGQGLESHYTVVRGYEIHADGRRMLVLLNPDRTVEYERFAEERWRDIQVLHLPTGISNLMIVVSNGDDLPPERWGSWARYLERNVSGLFRVLNGFGMFKQGRVAEGLKELVSGTRDIHL